MSKLSRQEQQAASILLIVFASLLVGAAIVDVIMTVNVPNTVYSDFVSKSRISFVMPYFLAYVFIGAAGLAGTAGLIAVYSSGASFLGEVARLAAIAYFAIGYWLWSAIWIVEHRLTTLAETPTKPPEWVINIYDASGAIWALPSWGSQGAGILLFSLLAMLLWRGVRLLPRAAAIGFALLAVSRVVNLLYIGITDVTITNAGIDFTYYNDLAFNVLRVAAFLLAAAALFGEKGIFQRRTRVGR